MQPNWA